MAVDDFVFSNRLSNRVMNYETRSASVALQTSRSMKINTLRRTKRHMRERKHASERARAPACAAAADDDDGMTMKQQSSRLCLFIPICHFSPRGDDTFVISTLRLPTSLFQSERSRTQTHHMFLCTRNKRGKIKRSGAVVVRALASWISSGTAPVTMQGTTIWVLWVGKHPKTLYATLYSQSYLSKVL